jgi:glutamate-ammonia-ligase adenylyltransferase
MKVPGKIPAHLAAGVDTYISRFDEAIHRLPDEKRPARVRDCCIGLAGLPRVWAASDFIANTCIANPLLLFELATSGTLDRAARPDSVAAEVRDTVGCCDNEEELHRRLRQARMRHMVLTGWRDLDRRATLEETMSSMSALADTCISTALEHHDRWLCRRHGQPCDGNGDRAHLVVLGLGKLGGIELNYSSDVDLVLAYSSPGSTRSSDSQARLLDNQEYFTRLGRKLVTALDPVTRDGFVFRTDLRLRPNGDSGPLVLSFPAMEHYYQTHGRNWERYALVKARAIAGPQKEADELLQMLKPFVYRKYLDFGAFDSIREMKGMIERELRGGANRLDIKLGRGGIREVEFLVQSYQLIRGGRDKKLQTQSLYTAMQVLLNLNVLEPRVHQQLLDGYRFLRNVEHRLQMVADRQTQTLPASDEDRLRLAWSMGFAGWDTFLAQLDLYRERIHDQFKSILEEPGESSQPHSPANGQLLSVWEGRISDEQAGEILAAQGFARANSTPQLLRGFRQGRLYQAFSGVERDRIDRLLPLALVQAAQHADAERAMSAFILVIEAIGRRSAYLSLLIENPIALRQLLHLCAASPWVSRHIGQNPVILDELLHPIVDIRERGKKDIAGELEQRLAQLDGDDEEGHLNALREFQHAQVLRVAAADVSGVLEVEDIHRSLTSLAEVLMQRVFDDSRAHVKAKTGQVPGTAGVIAYGKFASAELGYHSDLDVVVCYLPGKTGDTGNAHEQEYFYSRIGRRLIHLLTVRTQAGILYELDMRLRPSGRSDYARTSQPCAVK